MMDRSQQNQLKHLYRRMAFSLVPPNPLPLQKAIDQLFKDSDSYTPLDYVPLQVDSTGIEQMDGTTEMDSLQKMALKTRKNKIRNENIRNLNVRWVQEMANGKGALREKMSLFWHGHFACRVGDFESGQSYLETIRKYSLGSFEDLLLAVSKEPAMLGFLNNQQNKKNGPNENFAREVMELFTMGIGNYSETDVKEAARAFTGWRFEKNNFQFNQKTHDDGTKNVLGQQGNFRGEDVIRIILEKQETASFVVSKIYKNFVNEIPDRKRIDHLSDRFYKSSYNISALIRDIVETRWFYDDSAQSLLIKSPVELLVGIQRAVGAILPDPETVVYIQKVLGQRLLAPPNVAGWPGGRNWIDSSSLFFRMKLPEMLSGNINEKIKAKDSGDVNDVKVDSGKRNGKAIINWETWADRFVDVQDNYLSVTIAGELLAVPPSTDLLKLLSNEVSNVKDRIALVKKLTLLIMSVPEYQLV